MDLALTDSININLNFNSTTYEVKKVIVNKGGTSYVAYEKIDYSQEYFTIDSLEDSNTIKIIKNSNAPSITLYYSIDNGSTWTSSNKTTTWTLNKGDKVKIKANTNQYSSDASTKYWYFTSTNQYKVYGNIMSLLYGDSFASKTSLPNYNYVFYRLFYRSRNLVDASKLILSATSLAAYCYREMFYECTSLVTPPELPATSLKQYCYHGMFYGCTSLVTAPELKATLMQDYCYYNMFYGCTSLVTAPELPATTLKQYCYNCMFYGCTSLQSIKCLATNISATSCTSRWVSDVPSGGTFYKNRNMSSWTTGVNGIPSGWTVQNA